MPTLNHPMFDEQQVADLLSQTTPEGISLGDLAQRLKLSRGQHGKLREWLLERVREGKVIRHGARYLPSSTPPLEPKGERITGTLRLNTYGKGFVSIGEAFDEVIIAPEDQGPALDGDKVEVVIEKERQRRYGRIIRILERGRTRLTGVLQRRPSTIKPDDPRICSPIEVLDTNNVPAGQTVLASIVDYPGRRGAPLGVRVERALGEPGLLLTEVARALAEVGIEEEFPVEVMQAAVDLPQELHQSDFQGRLDLRHLHFVTIDPQTARDFDDAVAIEPGPRGNTRIWVAVADVSEYVREDSPLDRAALKRGCSIYLPDRAIPMLPAALSSQLCSLLPHQDRLAMVVRLDITKTGTVVDEECAAAVIHSQGRLDYNGVAAAFQGDFRGRRSAYLEHAEILEQLQRVADALHQKRLARGSLDLDLPEAHVALDEDDPTRVRDIVESRSDAPLKRAYNLIEELMIAANEAVGHQFEQANRDTIWRIHAIPDPVALFKLTQVLASYGIKVPAPTKLISSRSMARLLAQLDGHPAQRSLSYLVLRALKQAVYGVTNVGHFGLASRAYLHFTSPIRRYPDLHVHRLLKQVLQEQGRPAGRPISVRQTSRSDLLALARQSSATERHAIELEREVHGIYAASLMRDRLGDELWGTINGIAAFGFFVTLDAPAVEGLVKLDNLPGWFDFDPAQMRLFNRGSQRAFSLGDRVVVQVVNTSVIRRQVDLALVQAEGSDMEDDETDSLRRRKTKRPDQSRRKTKKHKESHASSRPSFWPIRKKRARKSK